MAPWVDLLPWLGLLPAVALARAVDRSPRSGPEIELPGSFEAERARRTVRALARQSSLALAFWLALILPLGAAIASRGELVIVETLPWWQLFWVHAILAETLWIWWLARERSASEEAIAWGLVPNRSVDARASGWQAMGRECWIGAAAGVGSWAAVMTVLLLVGSIIVAVFGAQALPQEMPPSTLLLAGLPLGLRVAVALSAGVFEELFFRGFLLPRLGVSASTALFVAAHAGQGQPLMLLGIALLSLLFSWLRLRRGSIFAAVVAHATFDLIQLVFVIPTVLAPTGGAAG
jgi:membrane protease YdiL (CAAX protease family)